MRRGLVLALLASAALFGVPAAQSADADAPLVYISPADGWVFPQNANFSFGFACISPSSAIVSCEGSQPLGSKLDTFHAGQHTLTVTGTDYEGRQTTAISTYTVFDTTKPHVVFRAPADGAAYAQDSTVIYDYSCEDDEGGLGILDCFTSPRTFPGEQPIDTSHLGTFTFHVIAYDRQFNLADESVTYSVVDRTPPHIVFTYPWDGELISRDAQAWVTFKCDDGNFGSGIHSCVGDQPIGPLDTSTYGVHAITVRAEDNAGNVSSVTNHYSVVYDFTGFAAPAAEYPAAATVKAGQDLPLKFSLNGDQGLDILDTGSPAWAPCDAPGGETAASGSLSYKASGDRYTYLASTAKAWAGTCRDFVLTLNDGTSHRARFTFSK